jgi:hypothetical protein
MTKTRWITLGLVVSLLMGLQHYGLEREAETVAEAPLKRVANLPASAVLPTYVATLFFGAFRAVAVDILWIQLRKVKEEKRWYEMKEVTEFISYVQPRNPEVWSHLAWDSAYNIANGFTDKEESWKWVKFGLLWLRRGISTLPNEPYLKDQLAYTLWHKVGWRDGELDLDLLRRIEGDAELQAKLLPDGMKADRPLTAFELAIPWLELAREDLMDKEYQLTQMGLYLYPERMDGFSRYCMVLQGMYDWQSGRPEKAKMWFGRARKQVQDLLARTPETPKTNGFPKKYKNSVSTIFADWEKLYARYPELVDLEVQARSKKPEDERALLALMQGLLVQFGPIDELWLWNRYNPRAPLNALKMRISQDTLECNDSFDLATDFPEGQLAVANFAPEGMDVDVYALSLAPPSEQQPGPPPRPMTATMELKRPQGASPGFKVKVSVSDIHRRPIKEEIVDLNTSPHLIRFSSSVYGRYFVRIEMEPSAPPWPSDTRYHFKFSVER